MLHAKNVHYQHVFDSVIKHKTWLSQIDRALAAEEGSLRKIVLIGFAIDEISLKVTHGHRKWGCKRYEVTISLMFHYIRHFQLLHTYIHTYKQIYIAPKSWKRIRGAGAG